MTGTGRARAFGALLLAATALVALTAADASHRASVAAGREGAVVAVAARLPSADLALSGGARWLRAPSLAEPSAPFDLGPAVLDPDPAGGLLSPPRGAWAAAGSLSAPPAARAPGGK